MQRVGVVVLLLAGVVLAAGPAAQAQQVGEVRVDYVPMGVPQRMNLQGYLTDTSGVPITGTLTMAFRINGGGQQWTETQNDVQVTDGLFSVKMGTVTPIPFGLFEPGTRCSLQLKVGSDSFPYVEITSAAFAYRSVKSDTAVYAQSSAGGPPLGPAGGDLTGTYPDPTVAKIRNRTVSVSAPSTNQVLTWTGSLWAPEDPTVGPHNHLGETWSTSSLTRGLLTVVGANTTDTVYGLVDSAVNAGTGRAYGVMFSASGTGTGVKTGVLGKAYSPSGVDAQLSGVRGEAYIEGTDLGTGGSFSATGSGSGTHRGVSGYVTAAGEADAAGVEGSADANGSGLAVGGNFFVGGNASATGGATGVYSYTQQSNTSASADGCGINALCYVKGSGSCYGGKFFAGGTGGTGPRYGVYSALGSGGSPRYAGYYVGDHVITGSKSAAVKLAEGDWRLVYCQESPELWFEDFGEGQLVNGRTHVELDEVFLRTVTVSQVQPMKVFVQLDGDCKGVFVQRGLTGFDVVELGNGASSASFTYRIVAKRKGYEDVRLHKMEPGTNPDELQAENARLRAQQDDRARKHAAKASN